MSNENEELETQLNIGLQFKKAREKHGLKLETVAQELHIMPSFLRALEEENFDKITHGPTFIKGYMRSYAVRLGVDPEPLIDTYNRKTAPLKKRHKFIPSHRPVKAMVVGESKWRRLLKKLVSVLIVAVVVLIGFFFLKDHIDFFSDSAEVENNVAPLKLSPETPVPILSDTPYNDSTDRSDDDVEPSVSEDEVVAVEESKAVVDDIVIDTRDVLIFELNDDSWIEVRDATGSKIFADLARRDSRFELKGVSPFAVILGNGKAVNLTFNDRAITFSFGRNNYAEFTIEK